MSVDVTILSPPPLHVDEYPTQGLSANKDTLKGNLWRKIFSIRLKYMRYFISDELPGEFKVKRYEDTESDELGDNLNLTEYKSLNRICMQCKEEADSIAEEIQEYLDAAKKKLHVNIVHTHGAEGVSPPEKDVTIGGDGEELGLIF